MTVNYNPLVSIIVPTFNRAQLVKEAISSVLNQTYRNFEIIVIDDNSTDNTAELISKINDGRIYYFRLNKNQGAPAARNLGLKKASGQLIAFLDSDDQWVSKKLEKQIALFEREQQIGLVYTGIKFINSQFERILVPKVRGDISKSILKKNYVGPTSSVVIKKALIDEVGGFDVTLPSCQDWDLFIRIGQVCEIDYIAEPLVLYFEHEGTRISTNPKAVVTGHLKIYSKYRQHIKALSMKEKQKHFLNMGKILLKASLLKVDKNIIEKSRFIERIIFKVIRFLFMKTVKFSPLFSSKLIYYKKFRKRLNLKNPQTFNEKLMWLKFNEEDSLKTLCTDKSLVRDYLSKLGYSDILVDLYQTYDSTEQIDFEQLPNSFVLKCTHGSGFNIICSNKKTLDKESAIKQLKKWMIIDYSLLMGESHYSKIKPRIIAEQYLGEEGNNKLPVDYKIHCFHGEPKILDIVLDRGTNEKKHIMFNSDWEMIPYTNDSINFKEEIKKPEKLEEMLEMARGLSKGFTYVRADFYYYNDKIYFGELTFTPGACLDTDYVEGVDSKMGQLIDLTILRKENLNNRLIRI
ncbi:MAG: ATP-grasp fold amidoligase family protein [Solibacillus sp.]|uniref:ATP-grasp fold amidoligase family protein n=1 Tax=Solibacillus sp. TaxID=1909654 RepID=UPI00331624AE